ncbi:unnamed protein product, partial [Amoebophrya sp. A120]
EKVEALDEDGSAPPDDEAAGAAQDADEECCFVFAPGVLYSNENGNGNTNNPAEQNYYLQEARRDRDGCGHVKRFEILKNCNLYEDKVLWDLLGTPIPAKYVGRKPKGCPENELEAMHWLMQSLHERQYLFDRLHFWETHADRVVSYDWDDRSAGLCCFVYVHNLHARSVVHDHGKGA